MEIEKNVFCFSGPPPRFWPASRSRPGLPPRPPPAHSPRAWPSYCFAGPGPRRAFPPAAPHPPSPPAWPPRGARTPAARGGARSDRQSSAFKAVRARAPLPALLAFAALSPCLLLRSSSRARARHRRCPADDVLHRQRFILRFISPGAPPRLAPSLALTRGCRRQGKGRARPSPFLAGERLPWSRGTPRRRATSNLPVGAAPRGEPAGTACIFGGARRR